MPGREWQQRDVVAVERGSDPGRGEPDRRRAYYRVSGLLPIRITRLAPDEVEATIFDLSMPDPLVQPIEEDDPASPLAARLRRIEEKLDLLLGGQRIDVPRQLSGRDRRPIVFSGSGLAVGVPFSFRAGEHFKVEILLPPPYARSIRAVAEAVRDAEADARRRQTGGDEDANRDEARFTLPLAIRHMEPDERDALVAYSYDLQRVELRARGDGRSADGLVS